MGNKPGPAATDWEKIQRLLSEYCHAVDEGRFDDFELLFTEDAVVTARLAGTTYRGPVEIRGFLEVQPAEMRGLHVTVNPDITIDGDEASVRADFYVPETEPASSERGVGTETGSSDGRVTTDSSYSL